MITYNWNLPHEPYGSVRVPTLIYIQLFIDTLATVLLHLFYISKKKVIQVLKVMREKKCWNITLQYLLNTFIGELGVWEALWGGDERVTSSTQEHTTGLQMATVSRAVQRRLTQVIYRIHLHKTTTRWQEKSAVQISSCACQNFTVKIQQQHLEFYSIV